MGEIRATDPCFQLIRDGQALPSATPSELDFAQQPLGGGLHEVQETGRGGSRRGYGARAGFGSSPRIDTDANPPVGPHARHLAVRAARREAHARAMALDSTSRRVEPAGGTCGSAPTMTAPAPALRCSAARRDGRGLPVRRGGGRTRYGLEAGEAFRWQGYVRVWSPGSVTAIASTGRGTRRRRALQPGQAAAGSVRAGGRGQRRWDRRCSAMCSTIATLRTEGLGAVRPPFGAGRVGVRMGRRSPPRHADGRLGLLRGPRQGLHEAQSRRARGAARHVRRGGASGRRRAPETARHHGRRAAARPPVRP